MSNHSRHLQRCLASKKKLPKKNPLSDGTGVTSATHRDQRGITHGNAEERSARRVEVLPGPDITPDEQGARSVEHGAGGAGLTEPGQTGKRKG